jgi:hypothetical protein
VHAARDAVSRQRRDTIIRLFVKSDGTLCGDIHGPTNECGQLGDRTKRTTSSSMPVFVASNAVRRGGGLRAFAVHQDGRHTLGHGKNDYGQSATARHL